MASIYKILCAILGFAALSCGGASAITDVQRQEFKQLISNGRFEMVADWARPLTTNNLNQISNAGILPNGSTSNRINLIGNSNYFRMKGDSVEAYLPYFGERQMGGGYGSSSNAITFNGLARDLEIAPLDDDTGYKIEFTIAEGTETYQVHSELYPSMRSDLRINSNQRFPIRYDGKVSAIE